MGSRARVVPAWYAIYIYNLIYLFQCLKKKPVNQIWYHDNNKWEVFTFSLGKQEVECHQGQAVFVTLEQDDTLGLVDTALLAYEQFLEKK